MTSEKISASRLDAIGRIARKYGTFVDEIKKEIGGSGKSPGGMFNHVTAATSGLLFQFSNPSLADFWDKNRSDYVTGLGTLKTYLGLLRDFPEFKEEELYSPEKYGVHGTDPVVEYVRQAGARLRGPAHNEQLLTTKPEAAGTTLFTPYPDWNFPLFDHRAAREVQRVVLADVALDSLIEFMGTHPSSIYHCKVVEMGGKRKVKVWFNPDAQCVIGPIGNITAYSLEEAASSCKVEEGVMEVGKMYVMPHFTHQLEGERWETTLDYARRRFEQYKKIRILTPETGGWCARL